MGPNRVSNPGPLTYESGALPTGQAKVISGQSVNLTTLFLGRLWCPTDCATWPGCRSKIKASGGGIVCCHNIF